MSEGMASAADLLRTLKTGLAPETQGPTSSADKPNRLATIDPLYTGSGNPLVTFDGETLIGSKPYPFLGSKPTAGTRVVMLPIGNSYVIAGSLNAAAGGNVGDIIEGIWTTAPAGSLMADGSVFLRATYPALGALCGTRFNTGGETSAQCRLPDFRGRFLVQKNASGSMSIIDEKGGAETVTLVEGNLPPHFHFLGDSEPGYAWGFGGGKGNVHINEDAQGGPSLSNQLFTAQGAWNKTTSIGSGVAHENRPPYVVVNRAIKF